jgi:hypothetical protein
MLRLARGRLTTLRLRFCEIFLYYNLKAGACGRPPPAALLGPGELHQPTERESARCSTRSLV